MKTFRNRMRGAKHENDFDIRLQEYHRRLEEQRLETGRRLDGILVFYGWRRSGWGKLTYDPVVD